MCRVAGSFEIGGEQASMLALLGVNEGSVARQGLPLNNEAALACDK